MTDDLGLGLSEDRPARTPKPPYGRRRLAVVLIGLAVVAVVVLLGLGAVKLFNGLFGAPADYSGNGTGTVEVQIRPGESLTEIGNDLAHAGVVASAGAFTDAANGNDKSSSIGPGTYRLHRHMSASAALTLLLDPKSLVQAVVVVPEGLRMRDIFARIDAASDHITVADLQAAAQHPAALGVPSWDTGNSLEGFLFPATYNFPPDTTATQALQAMVTRFNQEASSTQLVAGARRIGYSPYDVLTIASIIEREGIPKDFPKIAEVLYNRLHRGMPLQVDSTSYYDLPPNHGPLTNADLHSSSPYNTRIKPGLPPTPIASPGTLALQAALNPARGPLLYFVTIDKQGNAAFATTAAEFRKLVAESRRNGVQG